MKLDYELGDLAANQAGYLGHEQAISRGMTEDAIHWRLRQKIWLRAARGLYLVNGIKGDYQGLIRAAMAILPDPTVSHESAAELIGIPDVPRERAVVTVHAGTTHGFPGVTIHRSIDLADRHRSPVEGLLTTTPARTLVDLASVLGRRHMAHVLDEALATRIADIEDVQTIFDEIARRGRPGSANMRVLLRERIGSDLLSATRLERRGMSVFEEGGLPRPVFQYPAPWDPTRRIDFAWPHFCVGCECDSRRWHTRVNDFQNDRNRDNFALNHNWRIFRFTWDDFQNRPHVVVAQLKAALAA